MQLPGCWVYVGSHANNMDEADYKPESLSSSIFFSAPVSNYSIASVYVD